MKFRLCIFIILTLLLGACRVSEKEKALADLDYEISLQEKYDREKENRIEEVKKLLNKTDDEEIKLDLNWKIIKEYDNYQADSAEYYSSKLIELAEEIRSAQAQALGLVGLMVSYISMGYYKEALDILNVINEEDLPEEESAYYYKAAYRLYTDLENFVFESNPELKKHYREQRIEFLNALIEESSPNTYEHDSAIVELDFLIGKNSDNIEKKRLELINRYQLNPENLSIQYFKLGKAKEKEGKIDDAIILFSRGAASDVRGNNKNSESMIELAYLLNEDGYYKKSFEYYQKSSMDANFLGSQMKKGEIIALASSIKNYSKESKHKKYTQKIIVLAIALIFIIVSVYLLVILRERKEKILDLQLRAKEYNQELEMCNREISSLKEEERSLISKLQDYKVIKDHYISDSLDLSGSLTSMESRVKEIIRQIKDKKYENIKFNELESLIKEERQRLYRKFDKAFVEMFPSFIEELNSCLKEGEQIEIGKDGEMPVEVRIFALMRLGITEPADVASYLNLTINTIYVYKNKLRSKSSVDNAIFDKIIMAIAPKN